MLESLRGAASAALLVLAAIPLGGWILRRIDPSARPALERLVLSAGIGLGALSYVPVVFGALGVLDRTSVRGLWVALLALTAQAGLIRLRLAIRSRGAKQAAPVAPTEPAIPQPLWSRALAWASVAAFAGISTSALTPMVDYDGLAYHVAAPARWLEAGTLRDLPTWLHTYWPLGTEMLFALLLPVGGAEACKPLIAIMAALAALAVVALGERVGSRPAGVVAAGLLVWRMDAPSIGTTSVEAPLTLYVVLAALSLTSACHADTASDRRRALALCVCFAGFACCTKLNGLLCAAFLAVAAVAALRRSAGARSAIAAGAAIFGGAVLLASPWYVRTWFLTGNPVYPFGYSLLGGRHWSAEAATALELYFRSFVLPGDTVAERLAFVQRHTLKLAMLTVAALCVPGPRWARGMVLVSCAFAIVQVQTSDIARFLLPAVPFGALAVGWWVAAASNRLWVLGWAASAWFGAAALPGAFHQAREAVPVALGVSEREAFVDRFVNNRRVFEWANANLPSTARVLYGPDNRTLFLRRPCYWSSEVFQRQIDYRTVRSFKLSLDRLGITHLILNRQTYGDPAIGFETRMGWRANEQKRLDEVRLAQPLILSEGECEVYDLRAYLHGNSAAAWKGSMEAGEAR